MLNKKIMPLLLTLVCSLSSCTIDSAQQNANEYAAQYKTEFMQKVTDVYGNGASLTNIRGIIDKEHNSSDGKTTYLISETISGKLRLNDCTYSVKYHTASKKLESDMYAESIKQQTIDALPIDQSAIKYSVITDNNGSTPMFDCTVTSLDGAAVTPCSMYTYIVTTENISVYEENDMISIEQMNRIAYGQADCRINIISIKDDNFTSSLKEDMLQYDLTNDTISDEKSTKAIFEKYGINTTTCIYFQNNIVKCHTISATQQ